MSVAESACTKGLDWQKHASVFCALIDLEAHDEKLASRSEGIPMLLPTQD